MELDSKFLTFTERCVHSGCNEGQTFHLTDGRYYQSYLQGLRNQATRYQKESEVTQLCLTLCYPMDSSLLGSSIHGIFQAGILEWVAISFSRRFSRPRDWTQVSRIVGRRFIVWATREVKYFFEPPFFGEWGGQEYRSALPFPSPGDLLDRGIELVSPAL